MEQMSSGIGMASFLISIVVGILVFLTFVVAGVLEASTPGGLDESSVEAITIGLTIIALLFADVLAFGLGVSGLFQKDRTKTFSILGTIFSFATVGGTIALITFGIMIGDSS